MLKVATTSQTINSWDKSPIRITFCKFSISASNTYMWTIRSNCV